MLNPINKTIELGDGRTITIETGKLAKQADGAANATDDTVAELHAAEAAFRAQRQQILPLYKQVMDWYR